MAAFGRVDRRRRQDRRRFAADRHVRRGFIALRPFRLTAVLLLGQGVGGRPQSNGESDACRRAKKMRGPKAARRSCHASTANLQERTALRPGPLAAPPEGVRTHTPTAKSLRRFDAQHRSHSGVFKAAPLTAYKRQAGRSRKGRPARWLDLKAAQRRRQSRYLIWSVQYRSRRSREAFIRAKSSPGMPPICSIVRACFS